LENKMLPALSDAEKSRLKDTEGKWPEYPKLLHEFAQAHHLVIPNMSLPGPQQLWIAARAKLPDVPDDVLRQFASTELSEEERSRLKLSADPGSRDRVKQEYFKRYPGELKRHRVAVEKAPAE
jgi:hypothetical protein